MSCLQKLPNSRPGAPAVAQPVCEPGDTHLARHEQNVKRSSALITKQRIILSQMPDSCSSPPTKPHACKLAGVEADGQWAHAVQRMPSQHTWARLASRPVSSRISSSLVVVSDVPLTFGLGSAGDCGIRHGRVRVCQHGGRQLNGCHAKLTVRGADDSWRGSVLQGRSPVRWWRAQRTE